MSQKHQIQNPIIPGFYPDPTAIRVGDDFYLATSSFELCPGIPVFHSKDLANWEKIGYALTPDNGFHVTADMGNGGIMAPTLRYHDGVYYMVCCNFADKGNFFVTATDPAGPWSEPQWITDIPDIDCSLFFDNDGKSYLVSPGDDPSEDNGRAIFLTPYDLEKNQATGARTRIWNSAMRNAWAPEAPHIYHIGDYYYLMIAEGGTEHFHAVTVARCRDVDGEYEGYPGNPVMTHRHLGWDFPIDNVGHADLIETPSGNWYAVLLGSRIIEGQHKNFGRETYLCPVKWEREWPIFSPETGKIEWSYPADPTLPWTEYEKAPARDDFETEGGRESRDFKALGQDWAFWGTPYQEFWRLENSRLYLKCLKRPFAQKLTGFKVGQIDTRRDNCVSYLAKRQTMWNFDVTLSMGFKANFQESAGLVIQQSTNHQYRLEQTKHHGEQVLRLIRLTTEQEGLPFLPGYKAETTEKLLAEQTLDINVPLILKLEARGQNYDFFWGTDEKQLKPFYEHASGALINPEEVGGMVGTMIGVYASGNGSDSDNEAAFDFFEMKEAEH